MLVAHCDCVAGFEESCGHVVSLLWVIETSIDLRNSMMVTQTKPYWMMPSSVKDIPYAQLKDIFS